LLRVADSAVATVTVVATAGIGGVGISIVMQVAVHDRNHLLSCKPALVQLQRLLI
jgi:hypothetical protein